MLPLLLTRALSLALALTLALILIPYPLKLDANGNLEWRRYFGGTNNDRSYDALQTTEGNFLMVGVSESNDVDISNNKGSYDVWAVMINEEGEMLWEKSLHWHK